jgi:voltage-gated potassium channel Kch
VRLLRELGYSNVRHYPGGLLEWIEHGEALEPAALEAVIPLSSPEDPVERRAESTRIRPHRSGSARFVDALGDRSVAGLFTLWVEIVAAFGVLYWALAWLPWPVLVQNGEPLANDVRGFAAALYFSAVTATSVGYGDIVPLGAARAVAILEGIAGLILFGCVVSKFVSRRQDQLIGEIHRIAFEDRLGRVRTNLHLVRTELQALSRLCEGHDLPPPEAVSRVESVSIIFVGELHAVHDLLYRPQQTPEEVVLEAILAGLASVFREFNELLVCVYAKRDQRPPALQTSLAAISRLAGEICGDCVPRQYAPSLRIWMDQIQRIARELVQS